MESSGAICGERMQERNTAQESFLEQTIEQVQATHAVKEFVHKHPPDKADGTVNHAAQRPPGLSELQQSSVKV